VFVCENNLYGITVSMKKSSAVQDIARKARAYDIPGIKADGMDVFSVYEAASKAVERARAGRGPSLLEFKTYRFLGHSRGDPSYGPYRTKEEWESWKKRDPLLNMIKSGGLEPGEVEKIDQEVSALVEEAVRYAESSPEPDVGTALEDIYA
jgi:TPP-dependent pyruvate/acetoin dehydrogenase alpha subunit